MKITTKATVHLCVLVDIVQVFLDAMQGQVLVLKAVKMAGQGYRVQLVSKNTQMSKSKHLI